LKIIFQILVAVDLSSSKPISSFFSSPSSSTGCVSI
jgi:hypothetical protein